MLLQARGRKQIGPEAADKQAGQTILSLIHLQVLQSLLPDKQLRRPAQSGVSEGMFGVRVRKYSGFIRPVLVAPLHEHEARHNNKDRNLDDVRVRPVERVCGADHRDGHHEYRDVGRPHGSGWTWGDDAERSSADTNNFRRTRHLLPTRPYATNVRLARPLR